MGYICNKNIKCADCEYYRRNPDEDRMFCYAEVDEKAEEAKNKAAKAAYVVVNHYSNENISEFDSVSILEKAFFSLDNAIKAANAAFAEDKANGVDHGDTEPITADNCTAFDEAPLYCIGEAELDNYECYHNFYAVFPISVR